MERMGAFSMVLISVLLITELHLVNTVPVPELSVKLLCELLCEHCNGVANMESGHCNCEVPEAHFKDNSPCLERVQISAAEMNLKLTHLKNTRRERSVNDLLGRINSKAVDDAQINYSQGYNKIPDESLTPPTPNPFDVNKYEHQTPDHKEMYVKRSINKVQEPELKKDDGYQEQSLENELFRKRPIHYFQTSSVDALYSKKSITAMPSSLIFSGSNLRSTKLPVFYPQRKKRSYTKRVQFARNEDGTISHTEITKSNENYDVIVNVQADISIPALKAKQVENEGTMNLKLQAKDDLQSQVSSPLVADDLTIIKSEQSNPKQNSAEKMKGKIKSLVPITLKDGTPNTIDAGLSDKFRSAVEPQILNSGESDDSNPTDLIDGSNSLLEPKSGFSSLASLKLPKLLSRCKLLKSSNENKILQRSKLDELKLKLEKLLPVPREQPRMPLSELLKGPESPIPMADSNPLAKLISLSSRPKCSTLLGKSQKTALGDLLAKAAVKDLKLKDRGVGMTLLEKIRNNQLKLKQSLLEAAQYRAQNRDASECQFENENSDLPLKLNPLVPIESKTHESTIDCDDEYYDDVASPMHSIDKSRSNSQKTENVGDEIRTTNTPVIVPVSQESHSRTFIPTAFSGDPVVTKALPNEPIAHVGEIKLINETKHEGNENEPIKKIVPTTSEPPNEAHDSNISPTQLDVADISIMVNISDSKSAHNEPLPYDSNDAQRSEKLQEPIVAGNVEALPADVSSTAPLGGLEPHAMKSEKPTQNTNVNIMDAKNTLSDHPHFVNHHDNNNNVFPERPNYYMPPEETYRGMFDPASLQQVYYPPLLVRNDLSNTEQDAVLSRPVVMVPNPIIPFDHPSRLTSNFNGVPDRPNLPLPNAQSGMIMRGFVPAESYPNNPANLPPSSVFILKPILTPDGNIPYPELIDQIRNGNAVIQIYPINLQNVDNTRM